MPPKRKTPEKPKGKAAAEEVDEEAEEQEGEGGAEGEGAGEPETDERDAEIERLKNENAEFQRREAERQAASQNGGGTPKLSSADLEAMTEDQREKIAEQTGFPFERILSSVRAQERHIDVTRRQSVEAKTNVREAIEDLIDRDPQAGKLKKHIREYFDDLPLDVRADPSAVARHMKKAVTYAKGAVG